MRVIHIPTIYTFDSTYQTFHRGQRVISYYKLLLYLGFKLSFFKAKMSYIWFNLLKCKDFLLFFVCFFFVQPTVKTQRLIYYH